MRKHHRSRAAAHKAAARHRAPAPAKPRRWWTVKRVVLIKTAILIGLVAAYTLPSWAALPVSVLANGIWLYKL